MKVTKNCIGKPLEKPFPSDNPKKKRQVCVKDKKGNVVNVHYGAKGYSDYTIHKDKKRRARFRARHKCSEKKDKTKAGFWACNELW